MPQRLIDWEPNDNETPFDDDSFDELDGPLMAEPPHPINWNLLTAEEAEAEWVELNRWVNWLRRTYGLPASVVPPFWHRPLSSSGSSPRCTCTGSALTTPTSTAPRHSVGTAILQTPANDSATGSRSGTRLDRDRPTRQTSSPGESPADPPEDEAAIGRNEDFVQFVARNVADRRQAEGQYYARASLRRR